MICAIIIKHAQLFSIWQYQTLKEQENFILPNPWRKMGQNSQKNVVAQHQEGRYFASRQEFLYMCRTFDVKLFSKRSEGRSEAVIERCSLK